MPEPLPSPALPAVLQGRYRLGPEIGRGGASVVYRARDQLLGRDVAIKVFTAPAASAVDLQAQEGEARLLGSLNHPNLVTLLDAGVDLADLNAPRVFLVMEFVEGPDLRRRLRDGDGPLSAFEVNYLGWDLLQVLEYVHDNGIIHRDLKPANVLLTRSRGRPPRGKLADFGIAMLRGEQHQSAEVTVGTAAYLSPEQVEGRPLTPATDIYSLGLVLLEAFTGRPAFPGGVIESAMARLDRDPVIPDEMPKQLADAIRRMTARAEGQRPDATEGVAVFRQLIIETVGGRGPHVRDPESERLAAVRDFNLLDTPPDREFDRITALAVRMFGVPVAVLGLVDEDRVWLKSRQGLEIEETDRARGLGSTGSLHDEVLIITDTLSDPRTAQLAGIADSPYRFYAGVPLISGGYNIGTFAIADTAPRSMSGNEIETLADLAAMALHEMEIRRAARRAAFAGRVSPPTGS